MEEDVFSLLASRLQNAQPDQARDRPWVTLSWAQSLDGSIASQPGRPLALSGSEALAFTHRVRSIHDAILVGIGTLLADDPRLTVRLGDGSQPQPVVLDSSLRFPPQARLLSHPRRPWVFCTEDASPERAVALQEAGVHVLTIQSTAGGRVDLKLALWRLGMEGIRHVMVEGGASVITSFLCQGLADQVAVTIAPLLVGGLRVPGSPLGPRFPRLTGTAVERFGEDLVILGKPVF